MTPPCSHELCAVMRQIETQIAEWLQRRLNPEASAGSGTATPHPNCAFCGWYRGPCDDNHAPDCSYWTFFGLEKP